MNSQRHSIQLPHDVPTAEDLQAARRRIEGVAHRTPLVHSETIDQLTGARVYFKCENLQKIGAFKFRGALNKVVGLPETEARRGIATHSSGNHGQAVALAGRLRGVPAYVVVPEGASRIKVDSIRGYGAEVTFCEPTQQGRESAAEELVRRTGAVFVHPYDDADIISGQASCAAEILEDWPLPDPPDVIIGPVGGGGLLAGTALAVAGAGSRTEVIGAEPEQADDAARSFKAGRQLPTGNGATICDGLRSSLGRLTFPVLVRYATDIQTVSEASIISAMRLVWERMKLIIEPSAAVVPALILEHPERFHGKRVAAILSGGNVDLDRLPWFPAATTAR